MVSQMQTSEGIFSVSRFEKKSVHIFWIAISGSRFIAKILPPPKKIKIFSYSKTQKTIFLPKENVPFSDHPYSGICYSELRLPEHKSAVFISGQDPGKSLSGNPEAKRDVN